ncbi:TPA: hypothetical protein ACGO5V_001898 [Streptococcus suis]
MTKEEFLEAQKAFFIRYSEHRAELALAEGKTDPETLIQSLVNAETTIANLLRVLNQIGIPYYNNNTLQPNIKKLIKVLDVDGIYSDIFKPSHNPLDDEE